MQLSQCEAGDKICGNVRRFYRVDFTHPSLDDRMKESAKKIKSGVKTVKAVSKGVRETAQEVKETLGVAKDVITTPAATLRLGKPLKPTMTDLSQEQINKARMVKASHIASEEARQPRTLPRDVSRKLAAARS